MNYTFHQLIIFLKLVELQSVTKTAEELHLTQPAVSIQLKNLQDQFNLPLFEIVSRKVFITEFGVEIAAVAQRMIDEARSMQYLQDTFNDKLAGSLNIAIVSTAKYVMPYFLSSFLETNPSIDLKMEVTNRQMVVRSLENNEIDFAMVSVLPKKLLLHKIALLQNKLYLVAGKNYNPATAVDAIDLSNIPLLFREEGSATRNAMEVFLKKEGIRPSKKIELMSNEAVKQAVIAGLGLSIMPVIGLQDELENGSLKIIEHPRLPIITEWNIVWLKAKNQSRVATAFVDHLNRHKAAIIRENFKIH